MAQAPTPTRARDVIAVFNSETQEQVFFRARPVSVSVGRASKLADHPVEDGTTRTDHRIILPVEVTLPMIVSVAAYQDVYAEIEQLFSDLTPLTVQTRAASYENMVIESLPSEESAAMAEGFTIALKLREVQVVTAQYADLPPSSVANKSQASTNDRGEQSATDGGANADNGTILYGLFKE